MQIFRQWSLADIKKWCQIYCPQHREKRGFFFDGNRFNYQAKPLALLAQPCSLLVTTYFSKANGGTPGRGSVGVGPGRMGWLEGRRGKGAEDKAGKRLAVGREERERFNDRRMAGCKEGKGVGVSGKEPSFPTLFGFVS